MGGFTKPTDCFEIANLERGSLHKECIKVKQPNSLITMAKGRLEDSVPGGVTPRRGE
jgi:hypothetical protein